MATTTLQFASVPMACVAAASHGGRCRHMAAPHSRFCLQHKGIGADGLASAPHTVMIKMTVMKGAFEHLRKQDISLQPRDEAAVQARHAEEAKDVGRNPTAIRETPDSGCPIFGPDGLPKVGLLRLFDSLETNKYYPSKVYLYQRPKDEAAGGGILVIEYVFAERGEHVPEAVDYEARMAIKSFCQTGWKFCHVWENPPRDDGTVVHTVNVGAAMKPGQYPDYELVMHQFSWRVVAVR